MPTTNGRARLSFEPLGDRICLSSLLQPAAADPPNPDTPAQVAGMPTDQLPTGGFLNGIPTDQRSVVN